jgi:hypothetical protein
LPGAQQQGQHAEIGQVPGGEPYRALSVLELRQLAFERISFKPLLAT